MPLSVEFLPPGSGRNPYLRLLRESLASLDVEVLLGPVDPAHLRHLPSGPGILHFHWPSFYYESPSRRRMRERIREWTGFLARAKARKSAIVWTVHNLLPHDAQYLDLEQAARQALLDHATHVITHCEHAAAALTSKFTVSSPITVIPHGHFADAYPPIETDQIGARADLGLRGDSLVLLHLGLLRPYKGTSALIKVVRTLQDRDLELVIAGDPRPETLGEQLRREADGDARIRVITNALSDATVRQLVLAADAVVLPYQQIMTSGSVVLAQSLGRAVVVPKAGCLPEQVSPETGVLYDPQASDGLLTAVAALERHFVLQLGRNAEQWARRWEWSDVATATLDVYRAAAGGHA